jgi:Mg-chelatase subunit ChlD
LIVSEQAVVRYNRGDPLGAGCGSETTPSRNGLLLAFYPSDTRALEHRFVRFGRADSPQDRQAEAFGRWLAGDEGRRALEEIGLRPPGSAVDGPLTWLNGVLPQASFKPDQLAAADLDKALQLYSSAQRPGRLLLALDSSGSMGADSRFEVAAQGVVRALDRMGERDEFGLWIFPNDSGTSARKVVPIGLRDVLVGGVHRQQAIQAALDQVQPAGNTPLFQTIADGVAAVGPSNADQISGLVVLTDGKNTTNMTSEQLLDVVKRNNVRVFVITVGDATCASEGLEAVTAASGGQCVNADLASMNTKLTELFSTLWSG